MRCEPMKRARPITRRLPRRILRGCGALLVGRQPRMPRPQPSRTVKSTMAGRVPWWRSTIPCSQSRQTAAGLAATCRGPGIPAASSRHKFRERHQPFAIGRTLSITEPHRLPRQPPSPGRRSRFYGCRGGQPTRGRGGEPRCLRCRPPAQDREWFVFPLCRRRSGGPAVAPLCSNDNTAGSARFVLAPGCTFGRVGIGGAQSKREDQRGTSARL